MQKTPKTTFGGIALHHAMLVILAPLLAVLTTAAVESAVQAGGPTYLVRYKIRDLEPSLIVVALMLPITVTLSVSYQLLLQRCRLNITSKKLLIASLIISFPLCCMAFAGLINYKPMYALAGSTMGITVTLPVIFHAWSNELSGPPAIIPSLVPTNLETYGWIKRLAEAFSYIIALLLCVPASIQETRTGFGLREIMIDFLEDPFIVPLAVYILVASSSSTGRLIRPKGFKLSSTLLLIAGFRCAGLILISLLPKTR